MRLAFQSFSGYNTLMGFLKRLIKFIKGLFWVNSAESKLRREFKRLENELSLIEPALYKNGILQGAFGEAVFILYQHTNPIHDILSTTLCSSDNKVARFYETGLFLTAFTQETHALYTALEYNKRKEEARNAKNENRIYEEQRKKLELFLKNLTGEEFVRIDTIIVYLKQLNEICKLSYVSVISLFDQNFQSANPVYRPSFAAVPLADVESFLESLYHLTADFQITEGMARAVIALEKIKLDAENDKVREEETLSHLKKMHTVLTRILPAEAQLKLLKLLKTSLAFDMPKVRYTPNALLTFSSGMRETFEADLQRIRTEIQNETVASEIQKLFEYSQLQQVQGYNHEEDTFLQQNTSLSFHWTVPLKVLKSFLVIFFDERAQALLNDVAIEGFFNNQAYKSEFSSLVYNCCDILTKVRQFENKFTKDGENYGALIKSYVTDSRRDESFFETLSKLVDAINGEAKNLLVGNCQQLAGLYRSAVEILGDTKKSTPDYISNAKVLFSSIRNRDKVDYLEAQFPKWNIFFGIMYNYGIVIPPNV
jgi:hypothetical protein